MGLGGGINPDLSQLHREKGKGKDEKQQRLFSVNRMGEEVGATSCLAGTPAGGKEKKRRKRTEKEWKGSRATLSLCHNSPSRFFQDVRPERPVWPKREKEGAFFQCLGAGTLPAVKKSKSG